MAAEQSSSRSPEDGPQGQGCVCTDEGIHLQVAYSTVALRSSPSTPSIPLQTTSANQSSTLNQVPLSPSPSSDTLPLSDGTSQQRKFTIFPNLPLELRLKIYAFVNRTPRIVRIEYKSVFNKPTYSQDHDASGSGSGSGGQRGGQRRIGRGRLVMGPSFVNRWVSSTGVPILLAVCKESREEALKVYTLAFGSLEGEAQMYFNFDNDILYFGNLPLDQNLNSSNSSENSMQTSSFNMSNSILTSLHRTNQSSSSSSSSNRQPLEPAPYRLDLFLGGDYYGVTSQDFSRIKSLILDVSEELYGRRSFCWEDIRNLRSLSHVTLIAWEENEDAGNEVGQIGNALGPSLTGNNTTAAAAAGTGAGGGGGGGERRWGTQRERNMKFYENSLKRVWDKYVRGFGEGLFSEWDKDGNESAVEWIVPKVEVWNACSGKFWGEVRLQEKEKRTVVLW